MGWLTGRKSGTTSVPPTEPSSGRKIGKYDVVSKIGAGGFGTVYEAFDPLIQRRVAIKTCEVGTPEIRARTYQEAQLAGRLQHPNIVTIYDFGLDGDVPYIVQEFLPGEDLDKRITKGELIPLHRQIKILVGVAVGLEFAHKAGVIHRDIKPSNIRLLDGTAIKIMDFGIAKAQNAAVDITKAGVAVGSAGYMSPEQICGDPVDHRTDIFSFGLLAYELLTGRKAFRGDNLFKLLETVVKEEPTPIEELAPGIPPALADLVRKAMKKEPSERFQSARELRDALVAIHESLPRPDVTTDTHPLVPRDEAARLLALDRYEVLDSEPEPAFDDLARLAARVSGTPWALISFVDRDRQWFKSRVGESLFENGETPRENAICSHTILERAPLVIGDLAADSRFAQNPLVADTDGPRLRFYAGAPLLTAEGYALGTLCVLDRVPRELTPEQVESLSALARQIVCQLELRRRLRADRERSGEALIQEASGFTAAESPK
jgi:eukaryotic-like serine/threonine-protein kinase